MIRPGFARQYRSSGPPGESRPHAPVVPAPRAQTHVSTIASAGPGPDTGSRRPRHRPLPKGPPMTRRTSRRPSSAGRRIGRLAGVAVATAAASGLLAAGAQAAHAQPAHAQPTGLGAASLTYTFTTLDNQRDPTFNQLLGINTANEISGYFGSGMTGHPNQGYTMMAPYGQANYSSENFPGSVQTQVTGLNNKGDTVGFWANGANTHRGFRGVERRLHVVHRSAHPEDARLGQPAPWHQRRRHRGRVLRRRQRRSPRQAQPGHRPLHHHHPRRHRCQLLRHRHQRQRRHRRATPWAAPPTGGS